MSTPRYEPGTSGIHARCYRHTAGLRNLMRGFIGVGQPCGIGHPVQQDYMRKFLAILHDILQREPHKHSGSPTSVTRQQMLCQKTNTGTPLHSTDCMNT